MTISYLKVSASGDDGWFNVQNSGFHTYQNQFPINSGTSWFRFRNCPILPSSVINSAYLIFQPAHGFHNTNHHSNSPFDLDAEHQAGSGDFVYILGDLPPNRIAPTGFTVASTRFLTDPIRWDWFTDWTDEDFSYLGSGYPNRYESQDIGSIVSEMVSYAGYDTGNSLMFFIESGTFFPDEIGNAYDLLWTSGVSADNGSGTASAALIVEWVNNDAGRNLSWGFVPPSACDNFPVGTGGIGTWETPGPRFGNCVLAVTENDAHTAEVAVTVSGTSCKMLANDFHFDFPDNSVINGIEVKVCKAPSLPDESGGDFIIPANIFDYEVRLHHATSGFIGANKANTDLRWQEAHFSMTSPLAYNPTIYGGQWDTWGLILTAADVKNSNFGVGFAVHGDGGAFVDLVSMKVWHTPSYAVNSGITLFIDGVLTTNSGISLFIHGLVPNNSGVTLYTQGPLPIDSGIPLNIGSGIDHSTSGVPLFVWGNLSETGSIPLFIPSVANIQPDLNLFVKSNTTFSGSQAPPLFIFASPSGTNAFERGSTLYIKAGDMQQGLNLFVKGDSQIPFSQRMNLFTNGGGHPQDNAIPMYIGDSGVVGSPTLYIAGQSLFEGHNPFALPGGTIGTGLFNLFLQQKGQEESVSLFIGNQTDNLTAPLFITSANTINSGLSLFAPSATVSGFDSQPLYSHGF